MSELSLPEIVLPLGWESWADHRKHGLRQLLASRAFRRTYEHDPIAFVHDCIDWDRVPGADGPTLYQEEILSNLIEHRREAVRGPHGLGKSCIGALVIHWFASTRDGDDWKLISTASAWRQLKEFLWPEVHKWARYLRYDVMGREPYRSPHELQDMALRLLTGSAMAVASDDPAQIEGAHADRLLYLYDEAKTIPAETWEASEGAFSGAGSDTAREAFALALSTPGEPHGRFYEIHQRRVVGWHARHVKLDEAIAAGRISSEWVAEREEDWGKGSALFANRVLGDFAAGSTKAVIPLAWVEAAVERWREASVPSIEDEQPYVFEHRMLPLESCGAMTCVGADISDQGEDKTVLAMRHGIAIREIRKLPFDPDPMESAGAITGVLRKHPEAFPCTDTIGVGSGVHARLKELKAEGIFEGRPISFDAAEKSNATDAGGELEFANRRAEAWWALRDKLHPTKGDDLMLPPSDTLIADLTTPTWKQTSAGKILIESKDDLRKPDRLGRSPDEGDAVVMAMWARRAQGRSKSAAKHRIPGV